MPGHRRRTVIGIAVLAVTLAATAACGSSQTSSGSGRVLNNAGHKMIAFLMPCSTCSDRYQTQDAPDFIQAVHDLDPTIKVVASNAQGSGDVQVQQAETALNAGAGVTVVSPTTNSSGAAVVTRAQAYGASTIAYDQPVVGAHPGYYVAYDPAKVGRLQARYLADHLPAGATIAMINGAWDGTVGTGFEQGAMDVLGPLFDSRHFNLGDSVNIPSFDPATAGQQMTRILTLLDNKVDGVLVANDAMAGRVIAALAARNLAGRVLVTGQDASPAGVQRIQAGTQAMTVYKSIRDEAQAAARIAVDLVHRDTAAAKAQAKVIMFTGKFRINSLLLDPVLVDRANLGILPQNS
jgi:D-xylose transport system substrate-binding protein